MHLRQAANYFSKMVVDGWNGSNWVRLTKPVTFLPFDRFVSEREFGGKRRYMLVDPDVADIDTYTVVRLVPEMTAYLLGVRNYDMRESEYSRVQLVHRATNVGDIIAFQPTVSASGVAGSLTPVSLGLWHCDVERVTFTNSQAFDDTTFSTVTLSLPRDCPVDTDCEANIGDRVYAIKEVYKASGFINCRALSKHSGF